MLITVLTLDSANFDPVERSVLTGTITECLGRLDPWSQDRSARNHDRSPALGRITTTVNSASTGTGTPRQFQLMLRLSF